MFATVVFMIIIHTSMTTRGFFIEISKYFQLEQLAEELAPLNTSWLLRNTQASFYYTFYYTFFTSLDFIIHLAMAVKDRDVVLNQPVYVFYLKSAHEYLQHTAQNILQFTLINTEK